MARVALEHALPSDWIDAVFEDHRQRQYSRELLFSTVVELVTLVSLGLRPSLHAAARTLETLPVSMGALYDRVNRTEPAILRALVRGSAERLAPVAAGWSSGSSLPGWQLRVLDGNHLPASEKRLTPLRGHRGAALPGHTLVVYDPDRGLVTAIVPSEDAHRSARGGWPAAGQRRAWAALDRRPAVLHAHDPAGLAGGAGQLPRARAWPPPPAGGRRTLAHLRPHRDRSGARAADRTGRGVRAMAPHRARPGHAHRGG